jgi:hypothetical protein
MRKFMMTLWIFYLLEMVDSGYVLWVAVYNEPAAAVADKAHWTGRQHVIIHHGPHAQQL